MGNIPTPPRKKRSSPSSPSSPSDSLGSPSGPSSPSSPSGSPPSKRLALGAIVTPSPMSPITGGTGATPMGTPIVATMSTPTGTSPCIIFDFDGVLVPLREDPWSVDLSSFTDAEKYMNHLKFQLQELKREYKLYVCSQNLKSNIYLVLDNFYPGIFDGVKARQYKDIAVNKAAYVKSMNANYFIDDSKSEINSVKAESPKTECINVVSWTEGSPPVLITIRELLPRVVPMEAGEAGGVDLRF